MSSDRVISTIHPEARHTRKSRSQRRDGFRGHVAAEPDTGLVTDCAVDENDVRSVFIAGIPS